MTTPLGKARGLGSAKHGVMHWWLQRVTALALVPLTLWFIPSLLSVAQEADPFRVADWLNPPAHAALLLALIIAVFWHAKLGLQVVIEDYVHAPFWKYSLLLLNTFFCWSAAIASALSVLKLHMLSLVSGV